jgi:hypothetical protein
VAKLTKAQHTLIEVARNNQLASDSPHMRKAVPFFHVFPGNSYVLYRPPDNSRLKMQMPKAGPYIVVSVLEDKYSIQDLLTHKVMDTRSWTLMHPTFPNSDMILLRDSILQRWQPVMQENSLSTRSLTIQATCVVSPRWHSVRVHWKGYNPDDDTWQPMKTVRETQAFVDYCTEKKLSSLISKKFKA